MSQVWTAASIALLLRACSQAQLRRKEWEEWAVERHGSLQAAYSNPRVKVSKVEELLVEEWGQLEPTQAGMSAYSLHSYVKRIDTLKAELVGAQEEVRRRKEALRAPPPIQYQTLPQSDIPRSVITRAGHAYAKYAKYADYAHMRNMRMRMRIGNLIHIFHIQREKTSFLKRQ